MQALGILTGTSFIILVGLKARLEHIGTLKEWEVKSEITIGNLYEQILL